MHWSKNLTILAAAALLAVPCAVRVAAASPAPTPLDPSQLGQEEEHLDGLEGEISSIGDRLKQLQNQAAAAKSQQEQTRQQIARLTAASAGLLPKIEVQNAEYQRKLAALKSAIADDYRRRQPGAVMLLAESGSVSETLSRAKYRNLISDRVNELAKDAADAEATLRRQKDQYDSQKRDLELARRQLDEIAASVAAQDAENQDLLAHRSDEAAYVAQRVAQAKAIQDKLLSAAGGNAIWGTFTDQGPVHAGDVIGFEGSTGNSTGCHTHFSVIKNGQWVNPQPFLDSGQLRRPAGSITQGYGMTEWARSGAYGGAIHNGIDFVQPCGAPVRAAAGGTIIRNIRNDRSGFGHYVMIRHADGLITLYGHLI